MEITSRYDVFGPPNGCTGDCEGTGWVPYAEPCDTLNTSVSVVRPAELPPDPPIYRVLWYLAEARQPTDDGYHFLPCPLCQPNHADVLLARRFMEAA